MFYQHVQAKCLSLYAISRCLNEKHRMGALKAVSAHLQCNRAIPENENGSGALYNKLTGCTQSIPNMLVDE